MSRQCFQTFPSLHVPYPYTFIKLEAGGGKKKTTTPPHLSLFTFFSKPQRDMHIALELSAAEKV